MKMEKNKKKLEVCHLKKKNELKKKIVMKRLIDIGWKHVKDQC